MPLVTDTPITLHGFRRERAKADGDGAKHALLGEADEFVEPLRSAECGELEGSDEPSRVDANPLPRADREVRIVVEERDRIRAEIREVPPFRVDHIAVAIPGRVGKDERQRIIGRLRGRDLVDDGHGGAFQAIRAAASKAGSRTWSRALSPTAIAKATAPSIRNRALALSSLRFPAGSIVATAFAIFHVRTGLPS